MGWHIPQQRRAWRQVDSQSRNHRDRQSDHAHQGRAAADFHPSAQQTPDRPARSQHDGELQSDRRMNQGRQRECGHRPRPPACGIGHDVSESQPAQRERCQSIENHRFKEMVRADVACLRHQHQPDGNQANIRPSVGPDRPR